MSDTYTVAVHQEGDTLWAEVEELPGCFATGRDLAELEEALVEAITLYRQDTDTDTDTAPVQHGRLTVAAKPKVEGRLQLTLT
jgi:predicted RNase H-like HicB family nuclease